jgi:hypothetical protein
MDQFTRRIIGFGVHRDAVDGAALCCMFARAIRGKILPKYLSSDHDPLYRFQQWKDNLRVFEVKEIKAVPYVPLSHPFVERLIGTLRREYLDRTLFWTTVDLEAKLIWSDLVKPGVLVFDFVAFGNNVPAGAARRDSHLAGTARSSQGRAVVWRGEANP